MSVPVAPASRSAETSWDRPTLVSYLVARYLEGCSLTQLSDETRRSFGHVRRLLLDAGVTMRPRGGSRSRKS